MFSPQETAQRMQAQYGKDVTIHATYNLMQYEKGTCGYTYWLAVLTELKK